MITMEKEEITKDDPEYKISVVSRERHHCTQVGHNWTNEKLPGQVHDAETVESSRNQHMGRSSGLAKNQSHQAIKLQSATDNNSKATTTPREEKDSRLNISANLEVDNPKFTSPVCEDAEEGGNCCIHCLVSKEFLEGVSEVIAVISMPIQTSRRLKFVKEHEHYIEYKVYFGNSTTEPYQYRYCAITNHQGFISVKPECFYNRKGLNIERRLHVSKTNPREGIFNHYEGVIDMKPNELLIPESDTVRKEIKNVLNAFLEYPKQLFMEGNMLADEFLECIENIVTGLKHAYYDRIRLWPSEQDFKNDMAKDLKPHLENIMESFGTSHQSSCHAIAVIHLAEKFKVNLNSIEIEEKLCRMMAISKNRINTIDLLTTIKKHYARQLRNVKSSLQFFANRLSQNSNIACWMYCIPLLHFMSNDCTPYEQPSFSKRYSELAWWGVKEYPHAKQCFGAKTWNIDPTEIIERHSPFFQADYLLPRTLMIIWKFEDLFEVIASQRFPLYVILARLCLYLHVNERIPEEDTMRLKEYLKITILQMENEAKNITLSRKIEECQKILSLCIELLQKTKEKGKAVCTCYCSAAVLLGLAFYEQTITGQNDQRLQNHLTAILEECLNLINEWLMMFKTFSSISMYKIYLEMWNYLLAIKLPNGKVKKTVTSKLQDEVQSVLLAWDNSVLTKMYCEHLDEYGFYIQKCLKEIALKILMRKSDLSAFTSGISEDEHAALLTSFFGRYWYTVEETNYCKAFSWPPFVCFLEMFYQKAVYSKLSGDCKDSLNQTVLDLQNLMNMFETGSICIKEFHKIEQNFATFKTFIEILRTKEKSKGKPTSIDILLSIRKRELEYFNTVLNDMHGLYELLSSTTKDRMELKKEIDFYDSDDIKISDVCEPAMVANLHEPDKYEPTITAFRQYSDFQGVSRYWESQLLRQTWIEIQCGFSLTIEETRGCVWFPLKRIRENWCQQIKSGTMTFKVFHEMFPTENDEQLRYHISLLFEEDISNLINQRLKQMETYRELTTYKMQIKVLLDVVKSYTLHGDFEALYLVLNMTDDIEMLQMDADMLHICNELKNTKEIHFESLQIFVQSKELVLWLRESMTTGLRELKVFVELAMVSAVEGSADTAKIHCFHAATSGYAPLIFNIGDDIDYKEFIRLCQILWEEIEFDSTLPEKLLLTNKELEWFKKVKTNFGSAEGTILHRVKTINNGGIYQVGIPKKLKEDKQTMEKAVNVYVPMDDDSYETYTLEELQHLQSKLMLSPKKSLEDKNEIDRFITILDSVVRLSSIYIKLLVSGCVLFQNWQARLLCDCTRMTCMVKFGEGTTEMGTLIGRKECAEDDISTIAERLANFMEYCYSDWLCYIGETRSKYKELNFFTVDQIRILQKELVKFTTLNKLPVSALIFPLLSIIKNDCKREDISDATKQAFAEAKTMDSENQNDSNLRETEEDCEENFIERLKRYGFRESIVRKALKKYSTDQEKEVMDWCLDNDRNLNEKDTDERGFLDIDNQPVSKSVTSPGSMSSVTPEIIYSRTTEKRYNNMKVFTDDLRRVWRSFRTSSRMSDNLSMEDIGIILKKLREKDESIIKRRFQECFKEGEPNVLICPEEHILYNLLTIYRYDEKQPLPQSDEVLMCSKQTTSEQLDIFLRRTLSDCNKIHCLVHVDRLNFDVSDKGKKCLKEIMDKKMKQEIEYKLVIICCDKNQSSHMIAALDEFRRSRFPLSNPSSLHDYLLKKLSVPHFKQGHMITSASSVDHDRSSVRVVKSWRSGVGKTLYMKRLVAKLNRAALDSDRPTLPMRRRLKKRFAAVADTTYHTQESSVTIPLYDKKVNEDAITSKLLEYTQNVNSVKPRIFHIDIAHEVSIGLDSFLFQLLILGCISNNAGYVWRKAEQDHYLIEAMPILTDKNEKICLHKCFNILPSVTCVSPMESIKKMNDDSSSQQHIYSIPDDVFIDEEELTKDYQRPYKYLRQLSAKETREGVYTTIEDLSMLNEEDKDEDEYNDRMFGKVLQRSEMGRLYVGRIPMAKYLDSPLRRHNQGYARTSTRGPLPPLPDSVKACVSDVETAKIEKIDKRDYVETLLRFCGIKDPSWAELGRFASFLNTQFMDLEKSTFCSDIVSEDLPGFYEFVTKFLIRMSLDFATRSLRISDESQLSHMEMIYEDVRSDAAYMEQFKVRRTWETSPHPYIFFNADGHTLAFLGFYIRDGNLIDQNNGSVLEKNIMSQNLMAILQTNGVDFQENFDSLTREQKLKKISSVMGISPVRDPDETYELTTDNVKKMLAIYMRFRCNIPVIIMGETGCGKTRLVKFMCSLQCPAGENVQNMLLLKVHGGTTSRDIARKVQEAEILAEKNLKKYGQRVYTILYFDETNTTEAIGLIKEIICDKTLEGKPLKLCENLKIIAACNPYRKLSDEQIKKLEEVGLGYHIDASKTEDRLGSIPMRRLVYRVQPLPQSLLPLVWDFGRLDAKVEELYIKQIVLRYAKDKNLHHLSNLTNILSQILSASQQFMRLQQDECSFVSLRDVERTLHVMEWFYEQSQGKSCLFEMIDEHQRNRCDRQTLSQEDGPNMIIIRSLILALGVCYVSSLKRKRDYWEYISKYFTDTFTVPDGANRMLLEIDSCQSVFLDNVQSSHDIAKNQALKENVFMMVICIELKIPLFLVGKPGSSKSLAKAVVGNTMLGQSSPTKLFQKYKLIQTVSFQCSPLSTPEGIIETFRHSANLQKDRDLTKYASVVVLDEIGLAEDSPRMPLKTLHSLLENGVENDKDPEPHDKVGFIAISNWAVDPAKTNRGILLQREVSDISELKDTAIGICSAKPEILLFIQPMIEPLAAAYVEFFTESCLKMREFFGLRDFYGLIKMVFAQADKNKSKLSWKQLQHAVLRNFGGLQNLSPLKIFRKHLDRVLETSEDCTSCSMKELIQAGLKGYGPNENIESRYVMLMVENFSVLGIMQETVLLNQDAIVLFGSSFPNDQQYTQICRNINRVKDCMEIGNTVLLLNLEILYESLYDVLNQHYYELGGDRYVDLGLGSHRVKSRVHKDFRLIVVAEKETVYSNFPIPLINRLEKHIFTAEGILTECEIDIAKRLGSWANEYVKSKRLAHRGPNRGNKEHKFTLNDVFIGYNTDMFAALTLHVIEGQGNESGNDLKDILEKCKKALLWCATPDSVMRFSTGSLASTKTTLIEAYFNEQEHECLSDYLQYIIRETKFQFVQITTHAKLLTILDVVDLCAELKMHERSVTLINLQSFDTEQRFCRKLRSCVEDETKLLLVQSSCGKQNLNLLACARYKMKDEIQQLGNKTVKIVFIIQRQKLMTETFSGFQCGNWHSVHLDELKAVGYFSIKHMRNFTTSELILKSVMKAKETIDRHTDDRSKILHHCQYIRSLYHLILNCIHLAVAKVSDTKGQEPRNIRRIEILLKLLQSDGIELVAGLSNHVQVLLQEKEQNMLITGDYWLKDMSFNTDSIKKAGSFRYACMQHIERKITPVLAGIVAFMDTNNNLDCLSKLIPNSWRQQFWIKVINCPEFTRLQYNPQLMSADRNQDTAQFVVNHTGADGHLFTGDMPFSWLVYKLIQDILKIVAKMKDIQGDEDMILRTRNIILDRPLGKILVPILEENTEEVTQTYLHDFVHMVYPIRTETELEIITWNIGNATIEHKQHKDGLFRIIAFHVTYQRCNRRLKNFSQLSTTWPICCEEIKAFKSTSPNNLLFTDSQITVDVIGLYVLLQNMEPAKELVIDPEKRMHWFSSMYLFRPIVERIFDVTEDQCIAGVTSDRLYQCRSIWTRLTVVKLTLEHICELDENTEQSLNTLMPLLVITVGGIDLKKIGSLEKIENVIANIWHRAALADIFNIRMNGNRCLVCKNDLGIRPVFLPCKHITCLKCYEEAKVFSESRCQLCDRKTPTDFDPGVISQDRALLQKYDVFKTKCSRFFVDVTSQLCFADGTAPEEKIITKLMKYITENTTSILEGCINLNPTMRSVLLQLLLRYSPDNVFGYLQDFMNCLNRQVNIAERRNPQATEMYLLIIQCIEDSRHYELSKFENVETNEIDHALRLLRNSKAKMTEPDVLDVHLLYALADTKFGLKIAAKYANHVFVTKAIDNSENINELLNIAAELCITCENLWPCKFFVKQLCRCYSVHSFEVIRNLEDQTLWKWIERLNLKSDEKLECTDNYVVCGEGYVKLRETITKTLLGGSIDSLRGEMERLQEQKIQIWIWTLLAVYRVITMTNVHPEEKRPTQQKLDLISEFLQNNPDNCQNWFIRPLIENSIWSHFDRLNVHQGSKIQDQSIASLLVHTFILFSSVDETLLQPLKSITLEPERMLNGFLPTMPQDYMADLKQAFIQSVNENPTFYRCPNGHLYIVGNCGRPYTLAKCSECGETIGGQCHKPHEGNVLDTSVDGSKTGHILGRARDRGDTPEEERNMSSMECAVLRLLTHCVLLIGANRNRKAVCKMIQPKIPDSEVDEFFMDHILLDISIIQKASGHNIDDVIIFMHSFLDSISRTLTQGRLMNYGFTRSALSLNSTGGRRQWEERFIASYITPVLRNMEADLKTNNAVIVNDRRLGSDPLLCLLFEVDTPQSQNIVNLCDEPSVWRYRKLISIDSLTLELNSHMKDSYRILQLFLRQERQLRAIRFVPSIIRLQRILIHKYQLKLDRATAKSSMTLAKVVEEFQSSGDGEEIQQLINDFAAAWKCVKESLSKFPCRTIYGQITLPKEYCCRQITMETEIAMLLPSHRDAGLCSLLLLQYLLRKQNSFLDEYHSVNTKVPTNLPKVKIADVTPAHLISFHPEKDILPIVLANCNHSFKEGQGTDVEYDLQNIEKQLVDRYLFSKSYIDIDEIETMTYRFDVTNTLVFSSLREKIKQVQLSNTVRQQIRECLSSPGDTIQLTDLCESLTQLDIAVIFLGSVGGNPDCCLATFMTELLKLENTVFRNLKQVCYCKHIQSLWIMLSLEKTKLQIEHKMDVFECVTDEFKKELALQQSFALDKFCHEIGENLDVIIESLFECIMLRLSITQNQENEDYVDIQGMSLKDFFMAHIELPLYDQDDDDDAPEWMTQAVDKLPSNDEDPRSLQVNQAVSVWLYLFSKTKYTLL